MFQKSTKFTNAKKIWLAVLLVAASFVLLNYGFFRENLLYYLGNKAKQEEDLPEEGEWMSPNTLLVPSLGIETPIVYPAGGSEESYQIALREGVAHYPGTARIGETGNAYIFGHSSDFIFSAGEYKTIFALLPKIEFGATIVASDEEGRRFDFVVTHSYATDKNDLSVLSQETAGKKILTLQTSYPIGTALRRWIVVAELSE